MRDLKGGKVPFGKIVGRIALPLTIGLTLIEAAPYIIGLWQHPLTFHPENLGRFLDALVHNLIPHDPNALIGPAGFGTQGFLQPTGTWSYTVEFENDGSVAAQDVTVTEQLDAEPRLVHLPARLLRLRPAQRHRPRRPHAVPDHRRATRTPTASP